MIRNDLKSIKKIKIFTVSCSEWCNDVAVKAGGFSRLVGILGERL